MTRALAFLSAPRPLDFGARLARLRWRRAAGVAAEDAADWNPADPASEAVAGAQTWIVVLDAAAIPLEKVPESLPGGLAAGRTVELRSGSAAHTLRELELTRPGGPADRTPVAVVFRPAAFPIRHGETIESYVKRLLPAAITSRSSFRVLTCGDPSERERPELSRRLPEGRLRILDAGCGAGGLGLARARNPSWEVVGIEKDPVLAARARATCNRVLEGDLAEVLPGLASAGERFDAIVFADVLEHLEDPIAALAQARRLAARDGLLLASVPNAAHLSVVRDLLLGRFDPVPSGLCDAGHLRWFTRASLKDALEEAGWEVERLDGEPGGPPPDAEPLLALAAAWPDADRESLTTYQWIATARAR